MFIPSNRGYITAPTDKLSDEKAAAEATTRSVVLDVHDAESNATAEVRLPLSCTVC